MAKTQRDGHEHLQQGKTGEPGKPGRTDSTGAGTGAGPDVAEVPGAARMEFDGTVKGIGVLSDQGWEPDHVGDGAFHR